MKRIIKNKGFGGSQHVWIDERLPGRNSRTTTINILATKGMFDRNWVVRNNYTP